MMLPIAGDSYTTLSPAFSSQTCINLYPELANLKYLNYANELRQPKYGAYLVGTPGTSLFITLPTSPVRCLFEYNEILYAVGGSVLYSITPDGTTTSLGVLNTSTGIVQITINFNNQLLIVDGTNGYVYKIASNTFSQITDANFPNGAQTCTFQEGYGIVNNGITFALSALNDFTTWPATSQSAFGSYQDVIITVKSTQLETWVFGRYHTEVWYNAGSSPFPFGRRNYVNIEMGCAAPYSVTQLNNSLFWLGRDSRGRALVCMDNKYSPQTVSTDAVNQALTSYPTISDAIGYAYQDAGHLFYVLTFPTQDVTWVYDVTTDMWHQRSSLINVYLGSLVPNPHRHVGNCYAFFNGHHTIGDWLTGNIYTMSLSNYTDNSLPIIRERITSFVNNDLKQTSIYSFQLDMEVGDGVASGQGSLPRLMFAYSKDYGKTWSADRLLNAGSMGSYQSRARTNSLGRSRTWNFRIRYSEPTSFKIMQAQIFLTEGAN